MFGQTKKSINEIVVDVHIEFSDLLLSCESITIGDLISLRRHARAKTDLQKEESLLTESQKEWKLIYQAVDDKLTTMIGKTEKEHMDELEKRLAGLHYFHDEVKEVIKQLHALNNLFNQQENLFKLQQQEFASENKQEKQFTTRMLDSGATEERFSEAKRIQHVVKEQKKTIIEPLLDLRTKIQKQLVMLSQQDFLLQVLPELQEWFALCTEISVNNNIVINFFVSRNAWYEVMAKFVVGSKGFDVGRRMDIPEELYKQTDAFSKAKQKNMTLQQTRRDLFAKLITLANESGK
jgi:hypothetical protein